MQCLNCNAEMVNYDVITRSGELSYDVCEKCGSLWLDAEELDKMAFQVAGSIEFCSEEEDKTPEAQAKNCPDAMASSYRQCDSWVRRTLFCITAETAADSGWMAVN